MNVVFRLLAGLAVLLMVVGYGEWTTGAKLPVYSDMHAPARLSGELQDLPRSERFKEWYRRLPEYETAHKRLSDRGRGLLACGFGMLLALGWLRWMRRSRDIRRGWWLWVWGWWVFLWVLRVPLTIWYYSIRLDRFDYPTWGDSVMIGMFQDSVTWLIGCVLSSVVLAVLMIRRRLPSGIRPTLPSGGWDWVRSVVLWLWILVLLECVWSGVSDGDEGQVISCMAALPVLLWVLSAGPGEVVPAVDPVPQAGGDRGAVGSS